MEELWLDGRGKGLVRCMPDDGGVVVLRCEAMVDAALVDRQGGYQDLRGFLMDFSYVYRSGEDGNNKVMIGG
ncbi:unnamed protein product [Dovyalis caffra]|uniref:Uncharacterized protein n=1 Tax=Dovyalis caffra TaxID=77055 RepID=A0AAV1R142_9ROSI|nr:unnamed protein product [Dovyalis caffra]